LFEEILSNSVSRSPSFAKLRDFILLVTSQAISKIEENPLVLMDFFFSKTRRDCLRIQDGDNEGIWSEKDVDDKLPDAVDLNEQFSIPSSDPVLRCDQTRRLATIVSKSADGDEFLRWLSKSLRCVLYDDLEDLEDLDLSNGIFVSHFIEVGAAPSFVEEYIKNDAIGLLLALVGLVKLNDPDTFVFPEHITIQMIEAVERAKLFARREPVPPKKPRKRRQDEDLEFSGDVEHRKSKKLLAKEVQFKSAMVPLIDVVRS
jgi:hypothetical protein